MKQIEIYNSDAEYLDQFWFYLVFIVGAFLMNYLGSLWYLIPYTIEFGVTLKFIFGDEFKQIKERLREEYKLKQQYPIETFKVIQNG